MYIIYILHHCTTTTTTTTTTATQASKFCRVYFTCQYHGNICRGMESFKKIKGAIFSYILFAYVIFTYRYILPSGCMAWCDLIYYRINLNDIYLNRNCICVYYSRQDLPIGVGESQCHNAPPHAKIMPKPGFRSP